MTATTAASTAAKLARPAASMGGGSSSTPLLLDLVPGAFAAYDLRKLRNAYAGSCIRIRRDSDNTEQDIGFTTAGTLDTSAISSFCGAGSGYVTKWYDQSGNSRDLAQTTTTIQPPIFESGVLCVLNSRPCLKFVAATDHRLTNGAAGDWNFLSDGLAPWTFVGVSQANDTAALKCIWNTQSAANATSLGTRLLRTTTETLQLIIGNGTTNVVASTSSAGATTQRLNVLVCDPANATAASRAALWTNAASQTFTNTATNAPSASNASFITVGRTGTQPWDGTMQSLIWWASDQTSNRTTFETDLNTYYAVY